MSLIPYELDNVEFVWYDEDTGVSVEGESYKKGQNNGGYNLSHIRTDLNLDKLMGWLKQGFQALPEELLKTKLEDIAYRDMETWEYTIERIKIAKLGHDTKNVRGKVK